MTALRQNSDGLFANTPRGEASRRRNVAAGEALARELGGVAPPKFPRAACTLEAESAAARARSAYLNQRLQEAAVLVEHVEDKVAASQPRKRKARLSAWDRKTLIKARPAEPTRIRKRKV